MRKRSRNLRSERRTGTQSRLIAIALVVSLAGAAARSSSALGAERAPDEPLRVAVYDVPPYGSVDAEGLFSGASVDLWRRVAEDLQLTYRFIAVAQMEDVITGVERGQFDAAIGAITITPDRLAHVEFTYPAHRSGVAVALPKQTGPIAAVMSYVAVLWELGSLIVLTLGLLVLIGVLMWVFERRRRLTANPSERAVASLSDGIYWAAVTMTTVGYGDVTPITPVGRFIAVLWMLGSLTLISLLTTSLVSRMTADAVTSAPITRTSDLDGKRLAAVADASGAEYLDEQHLHYTKYANLKDALASLVRGNSDAVVNSAGALDYAISTYFSGVIPMPNGILAPAYMAFALPPNSPLKKPLDRALIEITASTSWRSLEPRYFGR
ncbi:MAG: transporter substrate-binding domain-containing protein [Alphaproteobacteria bacterium]|nr:transporter substrate-binding domain-containing protein [Alphaproteobacteria bacterium]